MGYFRFILALAVSANHLWVIGGIGRYAVFAFYILSGYLMTTIIKNRYGTELAGLKKYAINRFLRIYPIYFIALAISMTFILILGSSGISMIDKNLSMPNGPLGWFMNITLLGLDFNVLERTIPPSWTLFVEVFYYALIPLAVRAGGKFILWWVGVSIIYHLYFMLTHHGAMYGWNSRYGTVMAGSLGFSIGCMLRHYPMTWMHKRWVFISSLAFLTACYAVTAYWFMGAPSKWQLDVMSTVIFYVSMVLSSIVIVNLFEIRQGRIGNLLGDFSYSFYLLHLPVGFFIFKTMNFEPRSFSIFVAGAMTTLLFCFLLRVADKRINSLRNRIKAGL